MLLPLCIQESSAIVYTHSLEDAKTRRLEDAKTEWAQSVVREALVMGRVILTICYQTFHTPASYNYPAGAAAASDVDSNLPALIYSIHVQAACGTSLWQGHHIVAIAHARRCRLTHAVIERKKHSSKRVPL